MIDPFVILAPVLLLPVVALLRFVGCAAILNIDDVTYAPKPGTPVRINCGGLAVADWLGDADVPPGASILQKKDPTKSIQGIDPIVPSIIYDTARVANGAVREPPGTPVAGAAFFTYTIQVGAGNYDVNLKFAQIDDNLNFGGDVQITINGTTEIQNLDKGLVANDLNGRFRKVAADANGNLTIKFENVNGRFAYVNGIEILTV